MASARKSQLGPTTEDQAIAANPDLQAAMREGGITSAAPARPSTEPVYKVAFGSRVAVSKSSGAYWRARYDMALAARKRREDDRAWDDAIAYYRNDHRRTKRGADGEFSVEGTAADDSHRTDESIVFANTTALVPAIYAKNPEITCSPIDQQDAPLASTFQRLINKIIYDRASPGINLKPKMRRMVVMATLSNIGYLEIGYTQRDQSSQKALDDLARLSAELAKPDNTTQRIEEIEGEIEALEARIDFLRPSGPWCKFRHPRDVYVDPDSVEEDHSDARWIIICDYVSTEWLKAVYGKRNGEDQNVSMSIYEPTHVLDAGTQERDTGDAATYSELTLEDDDPFKRYGYRDEFAFKRGCRTRVAFVWDAITRRVLMYNTKDWSWPIWVWDDPLGLDTFYPLIPMSFFTDPEAGIARGEVTYYMDAVDQINDINRELAKQRRWSIDNVVFNTNHVDRREVERILKGEKRGTGLGVDLPEGFKLGDVIGNIVPPSFNQLQQLFDKQGLYDTISSISSVQPVLKGVEFKTNTTNDAIQTYNSSQQTRIDEKIDAVEDTIGRVGWMLIQLCAKFMSQDEVAAVIGNVDAWQNMDAKTLRTTLQMRVVGGSTVKPTSQSKQERAIKIGQVLGQFASVSPVVILVALRVLERAFDEVVVEREDWETIIAAIQQAIAPQAQSPADGAGGGQPQQQPDNGAVEQQIAQLPPQVQQAVRIAIQRGVPPQEALAKVQERISNGGQGQ